MVKDGIVDGHTVIIVKFRDFLLVATPNIFSLYHQQRGGDFDRSSNNISQPSRSTFQITQVSCSPFLSL